MPGVTAGVYTGSLDAGTEVSSTYEGRHVTVYEAELIHPFIADGFVNKGDPVVLCDSGVPTTYGHAVGVAFNSASALTDLIAVDTEGIWNLTVYAEDDNGNAAIEIGDPLYIRAGALPGAADGDGTGDAEISKIVDPATQVPFGYALGSVVAGGSGVIAVKVHWDPSEHWLQDNELMYFGDARDVSIEWDETKLEMLPVTDNVGAFNIGNGTLSMDVQIFGVTAASYMLWDNSENTLDIISTLNGAAADQAVMVQVIDNTTSAGGWHRGLVLDVTNTGIKTANASVAAIDIGIDTSADVTMMYASSGYLGPCGAATINRVTGYYLYQEPITGTVSAVSGMHLAMNGGATVDDFISIRAHADSMDAIISDRSGGVTATNFLHFEVIGKPVIAFNAAGNGAYSIECNINGVQTWLHTYDSA